MKTMLRLNLLAAVCAVCVAGVADGQTPAPGGAAAPAAARPPRPPRPLATAYPKPAQFPNENKAAVVDFLSQARKIAGPDLFSDFAHRCIFTSVYRDRVEGIQYNGITEPTKIFDNLYFIGQVAVSSQALVTSAGIVIFDTLNSEDEAKNIIIPNLIKLGLDPKDIKYVIVTHEHGDHYGGARYLQKTYGAKVLASKVAWDAMARLGTQQSGAFAGLPTPDRDMEISDDQVMKIGDTELHFYLTPGHTAGVVSTIFKVTDHGKPHLVGYFGGTGGGGPPENLKNQVTSLERWRKITNAAGVDVLVANHSLHDRALENNYILQYLKPGDPNPYVMGADTYQRYMQVQELCAKVQLARDGIVE